MASVLQTYREKQTEIYHSISANTLPTREVVRMQELNYRICVLETFQALCKSAPMSLDAKELGYHFQMVDAYVRFVLTERRFGPKTDENGQKKRDTALASFEKVVKDGRKRFSSFAPSKPEQYKTSVSQYVNAVLPVWMQYRNTYINL